MANVVSPKTPVPRKAPSKSSSIPSATSTPGAKKRKQQRDSVATDSPYIQQQQRRPSTNSQTSSTAESRRKYKTEASSPGNAPSPGQGLEGFTFSPVAAASPLKNQRMADSKNKQQIPVYSESSLKPNRPPCYNAVFLQRNNLFFIKKQTH
ncbi:hypothetical protein ACN47E_000081 [Coniothyrium glycines]